MRVVVGSVVVVIRHGRPPKHGTILAPFALLLSEIAYSTNREKSIRLKAREELSLVAERSPQLQTGLV
jgi:hypothetical protein